MRDTITMTIPALLPYLRLPRVAIAGIATRSGFSFDEVEDLRLAMGEVCQVLLDGGDQEGNLVINIDVGTRGAMTVDVTAETPPGRDEITNALAARLIEATVGVIEVTEEGRRITFSKTADEDD